MILLPEPNTIGRPGRSVSVHHLHAPLTHDGIRTWIAGRQLDPRTDYLVLRNGADTALARVWMPGGSERTAPAGVRLLAGRNETAWIVAPNTDAANATALAKAARGSGVKRSRAYVVEGRLGQVNFIWEPQLVAIRVTEVVPPEPPKLYSMAEQVVAFDQDLPPVDLVPEVVDIGQLASQHAAPRYLLPCQGSGVSLAAPVDFLDTRPTRRQDWLLIGCARSRQLHRHFYGDEPPTVDLCPYERVIGSDQLTLTKCCLRERGVEVDGAVAMTPWGASMDEVRSALRFLAGLPEPSPVEVVT